MAREGVCAETQQVAEWKLDTLGNVFKDVETAQAIVHVWGLNALDSVVYKLASLGLEAIPLASESVIVTYMHFDPSQRGDMNAAKTGYPEPV